MLSLNYDVKDTQKKAPSNETPALTKSTNIGIWVVRTTNLCKGLLNSYETTLYKGLLN